MQTKNSVWIYVSGALNMAPTKKTTQILFLWAWASRHKAQLSNWTRTGYLALKSLFCLMWSGALNMVSTKKQKKT